MKYKSKLSALTFNLVCIGGTLFAPLLALLIIQRFAVNVPYWDQWEYVPFFKELTEGSLTFSRLFAQQLEYRQFFPNLVFVALGKFSNWNVIWEMYFCLAIQLISLLVVIGLAYRSKILSPAIALILSLLIFHPFQIENWLSGVQITYFLGNLAFLLSIFFAASSLDYKVKVVLVALSSMVAAFSSANGLLTFLLSAPVIFFCSTKSTRLKSLSLLSVVFLASLGLYFADYKKPLAHPEPFLALSYFGRTILYFLSFLGRPLEPISFIFENTDQFEWHQIPSVYLSATFGGFLLILYLKSFYRFAFFSSSEEKQLVIPWLAIGAYSIGTALLTSIGRSGFGIQQSLSPRYVSFSIWLPVAIGVIFYLQDYPLRTTIRNITLTVFGISLIAGYSFVLTKGRQYRLSRNRVKACVVFSAISNNSCVEEIVFPNRKAAIERALYLSSIKYLTPPVLTSKELLSSGLQLLITPTIPEGFGHIDSLLVSQSRSITLTAITLTGSASLPARNSPGGQRQSPELIVVTVSPSDTVDGKTTIVSTALLDKNSVWLRYPGSSANEFRWRWKVEISDKELNESDWLQVWSYDVVNNTLNAIEKPISIKAVYQRSDFSYKLPARVG